MDLNNKKEHIKGWAEVLFLKYGKPEPTSLDKIEAEDYASVGGSVPLSEIHSPLDVYELFYLTTQGSNRHPRQLRAFDVINICTDKKGGTPMILLRPDSKLINTIPAGSSEVLSRPTLPLVAVILYNTKFPAYYGSI